MDLWIRSQDRKRLTVISDLRIYYAEQEDVWVIEDCDDLGYYKTQERALEVLDEIVNALLNKWANNVKYEEHYDNERPRNMVYLMPKE